MAYGRPIRAKARAHTTDKKAGRSKWPFEETRNERTRTGTKPVTEDKPAWQIAKQHKHRRPPPIA